LQRLIVGLLIGLLCLGVVLALQMFAISGQLDARKSSRQDMMEARIIVLEKNVEKLKAKEELRNAMPSLQDHLE